jgi:hypothetical protein
MSLYPILVHCYQYSLRTRPPRYSFALFFVEGNVVPNASETVTLHTTKMKDCLPPLSSIDIRVYYSDLYRLYTSMAYKDIIVIRLNV